MKGVNIMILIDSVAIRNIMISKQLGLKELANLAKIPYSTICKLAQRDKNINFKTAGKLIKALNVDADTIIKANQ